MYKVHTLTFVCLLSVCTTVQCNRPRRREATPLLGVRYRLLI
jgi:hypothetical protein